MKVILKGIAYLAIGQAAWGAQIVGSVDFSASFSTSSTSLSFVAGLPNFSATTNSGTTNYTTTIQAVSQLAISAGAASSIFNVSSEAISGVVRVTNSGNAPAIYSLDQSLYDSLVSSGPGTEGLGMSTAIERFNVGTSTWDIIGITSFSIGSD